MRATTSTIYGWLVGCLCVIGMGIATPALAQGRTAFDLPEQPLADTIRAIGQRTGTNVLFDPALTAGKRAPAIKGQFTPEEALAKAVADTASVSERSPRRGNPRARVGCFPEYAAGWPREGPHA